MKNLAKKISLILHYPALLFFLIISFLFLLLIILSFYDLFYSLYNDGVIYGSILEKIFRIFLFIELIAAIKLYFQNDYHFPLRFFIYIGITDILREIFISIEKPQEVLYYSLSVLVLLIALFLMEIKFKLLNKKKIAENNKDETIEF